jgi:hypothetical protein
MKAKTIALMLAGALAAPLAANADVAVVTRSFDNPMLPNPTGARGADDLRTWGTALMGQPDTAFSSAPGAATHYAFSSQPAVIAPAPAAERVYVDPAPAPEAVLVVPGDTIVVVPAN